MTVIPLVFSSLVVGVAAIGDPRKLGRVSLKSFAYDPSTRARLEQRYGADAAKVVKQAEAESAAGGKSILTQVVETIVPKNPIAAVASETPNMLHLMFFALVLGAAATLIPANVARRSCEVCKGSTKSPRRSSI